MEIFFTADTHFGHGKILTYEAKHRMFLSIEEHDEDLIANWNRVVRPKDIVWHLGDVYLGKDMFHFLHTMKRLNGTKYLVRGNHDTFETKVYMQVFTEIYGVVPKYDFVMSHVPLHRDSVKRWGKNVHGHLHSHKLDDPHYYCVSVEQHNLTPIPLHKVREDLLKQQQYELERGGV